jgi:Raf kinase inhibitor-like YbhB/YbcL family protein
MNSRTTVDRLACVPSCAGRLAATWLFIASLSGCGGERRTIPAAGARVDDAPASEKQTSGDYAMSFTISSTAFEPGAAIPRKYTGEGDDISPPLTWNAPPGNTKELALVCDDPDAPGTEPWIHWVIYGIAADVRTLAEGLPNEPELKTPIVARQGKNSWNSGATIGYRGPMPPVGHGTHHYHFKLYALDQPLGLASSATKAQLLSAMKGHVLAETELIGTYERKK